MGEGVYAGSWGRDTPFTTLVFSTRLLRVGCPDKGDFSADTVQFRVLVTEGV